MRLLINFPGIIALIFLCASCGGGGSSSSGNASEFAGIDTIGLTTNQVLTLGEELRASSYTGNTDPVSLSQQSFTEIAAFILDIEADGGATNGAVLTKTSPSSSDTRIDETISIVSKSSKNILDRVSGKIEVDDRIVCTDGGDITRYGNLEDDGSGAIGVYFDDCREGEQFIAGPGALVFRGLEVSLVMDGIETSIGSESYRFSGLYITELQPQGYFEEYNLTALNLNTGEISSFKNLFFIVGTLRENYPAELYIDHLGRVDFVRQEGADTYEITGAAPTYGELTHRDNGLELFLNIDGGRFDYEAFVDENTLLSKEVEYLTFNEPPEYRFFGIDTVPFYASNFDHRSSIEAKISDLIDPDDDELSITYHWQLNDVDLNSDPHSNILYPNGWNPGDIVTVYASIDDGRHVINTESRTALLEQAPGLIGESQTGVSELNLTLDQTSTPIFVNDASLEDQEIIEWQLVEGPDGLEVRQGELFWERPPELIFPTQIFPVILSDGETTYEVELQVHQSAGKKIVSSQSLIIPLTDHSTETANFYGDSGLELLTTDSFHGIGIYGVRDGVLERLWSYPWTLSESVISLSSWDSDGDGYSEPLIATETGISHLPSLDGAWQKLYEFSPGSLYAIEAIQLDSDAQEEILVTFEEGISVLDSDLGVVTNILMDGKSATDFAVGNLDTDRALELVTQIGEVYDLETGLLQYEMNQELHRGFNIVDYNNDGIGEILAEIGSDSELILQSVLDERLIWSGHSSSIWEAPFLFDIDSDGTYEIALPTSGNVRFYEFDPSVSGLGELKERISHSLGFSTGSHRALIADLDGDSVEDIFMTRKENSSSLPEGNIFALSGADIGEIPINRESYPKSKAIPLGFNPVNGVNTGVFFEQTDNFGSSEDFSITTILPSGDSSGQSFDLNNIGFISNYDVMTSTVVRDEISGTFKAYIAVSDVMVKVESERLNELQSIAIDEISDEYLILGAADFNLDGSKDIAYSVHEGFGIHNSLIGISAINGTTDITFLVTDAENSFNFLKGIVLSEPTPAILLYSQGQIQKWTFDIDKDSFEMSSSLEMACTRLLLIDDATGLCLNSGTNSLTFLDSDLDIFDIWNIDQGITFLKRDPRSNMNGYFSFADGGYFEYFDESGKSIWRTPITGINQILNYGSLGYFSLNIDEAGALDWLWAEPGSYKRLISQ